MNNLLQYLAESSLALLLFYALYRLLLSQQTCFKFNRFYLLASLLLSLFIPFLELPDWPTEPATILVTTPPLVQSEATSNLTEKPLLKPKTAETEIINYTVYLYFLYGTGLVVALLLLGMQLLKLYTFIYRHTGKSYFWRNIKIIPTEGKMATFSFLRYIFFDNSQALTPTEKELIFRHEQAHLQQKHSLDILLVRLLNTVFWFNPLFYLYRKALENTHEFLADAQVVQRQDAQTYAALLVQQVFSRTGFSLGSSFNLNKSLTLKRIAMLKKINLRTRFNRPILTIPVVCTLSLIFASNRPVEMPEFMSTVSTIETTKETGNSYGINAISQKVKQPKIYYMNPGNKGEVDNLGGPVIGSEIFYINLVAAPTVPTSLINEYPKEKGSKLISPGSQEPIKEKVYTFVDQPPRFPITKDAIEKYKEAKIKQPVAGGFAELALTNFLRGNLKYPAEAVKAKIEGLVVAQFIVDSKGHLGDFKIVKGLTKETDAETLRVIKSLPDFVPAQHKGQPVAFRYTLPVRFGL